MVGRIQRPLFDHYGTNREGVWKDSRGHVQGLAGKRLCTDDIADWAGSKRLIDSAIETFGGLYVLVNNAGILRDRLLINTSEQEWDDVIRVHMGGHFLPTKWAGLYWRDQSKAGKRVKASVVNTTSTSGLLSNVGQANYGAAKSGIAAMTEIAQKELATENCRIAGKTFFVYGSKVHLFRPWTMVDVIDSGLTSGRLRVLRPKPISGATWSGVRRSAST